MAQKISKRCGRKGLHKNGGELPRLYDLD